jgi:tetratricopeptide (TPR) repeat protein
LAQLTDWFADNSANPVFIITGSAGVGKSRLALKFASGLPEEWAKGWLRAGAGPTVVSAVRACEAPAIILVDDAEDWGDLVPLVNALAEQYTSPATRVILLARSAAGLTTSLASQLDVRHEWIVTRAPVLDLQPEGGPEDRERWFAEAVAAFAASPSVQKVAVPAPSYPGRLDVTQPILVLHAQALLAVLGTGDDEEVPQEQSFGEVAAALMKHEERRWETIARRWNWSIGGPPSEDLRERTIAALVLLAPNDDGEAEQILRRIRGLRDAQEERLAAIAAWTAALYRPGRGGGLRIRPDMVGEWFVVSQLTAHPAFAQNLRDGLTDRQAARALSFLARAADRMESASSLFADFASGNLRRRILAAAHAAMAGQVGRQLLDVVVAGQTRSADEWTIDQLIDLDRMIPDYVMPLTHIAIADLRVRLSRGLAEDNPAAHRAGLAAALDELGIRLDRVGRDQEALAVSEEAVTLYRALAEDNPAAHRAGLAAALDELGIRLDRVGRDQEALAVSEEAVTLYRALAEDNPAAHRAGLATALSNLSAHFDREGRYRDALAAAEEAVTLYRALAEDNPAVYRVALANALSDLSIELYRAGRDEAALAPAGQAVTLYRALAKDNRTVDWTGFAMALHNLGIQLDRVGRYEAALAAAEEAVTLYRALAKDNPAVHRAGLATALGNLSNRLDRVGRYEAALAAAEEAVTLYRALAKDNPAVHRAGLATALGNLGNRLDHVSRHEDALAARIECSDIFHELASIDPDLYQEDYGRSLSALRRDYDQRGMHDDAVRHHLVDPTN